MYAIVTTRLSNPASDKGKWRGIPTGLNNITHSREIREYFCDEIAEAYALDIEKTMNALATSWQSENTGVYGLEDYGALGSFLKIGSIGGAKVEEQDDIYILVAPQNAVGKCINNDLRAMTDATSPQPVILINPRLKWNYAGWPMVYPYELFKRVDVQFGKEEYMLLSTFG
ncbi:hypothetical protein MLD38_014455 [Melastoma candidum]|uniref:Uncharacterized protein n=1 Tax=Melastoma candidum TaxID=119954 RepID=A0ACB9RE60_9MYRT|nr:hypothetical protein MLD38_014455 [Melastoma candidum]